jgi:FkbM family methyltransferase
MKLVLPREDAIERNAMANKLLAAIQHYGDDLDLLLHLRWLGFRPDVVYDIGASNGIWSSVAGLVYPEAKFELFEPLHEISDAYRNARARHPAIRNFTEKVHHRIHSVALGSRNGTCKFSRFASDAGSTSLEVDSSISDAHVVEVPMRRLDDLAAERAMPRPTLIKMDSQGSEMDILTAATECLQSCQVLFLEGWLTKGYGATTPLLLDIANFLGTFGLRLFALGDEYRAPDQVAHTKDVVFVRESLPLQAQPAHTF